MSQVEYLDDLQAAKFLKTIVSEYVSFMKKYNLEGNFTMFSLDYEDKKSARGSEYPETLLTNKVVEDMIGKVECSDPLKASLLEQMICISTTYEEYKDCMDNKKKNRLFKDIYQKYVDIFSGLSYIKAPSRFSLGFVLNVIVKNDFFNFIYQNDNSCIKVLGNIRKHNNIINDLNSWGYNKKFIMHILSKEYSKQQLIELTKQIESQKTCLLFDKNKHGDVNFILLEVPQEFLLKLITLCHIMLFMLGISDKLVLDQTLFESYWQEKFLDLKDLKLKGMQVQDMVNQFKINHASFSPTDYCI